MSAPPDFGLVVLFASTDVLVADFFAADFFCDFFFDTTRLVASFLRTLFFAGLAFFVAVFFVLFLCLFLEAIINEVYHFTKSPIAWFYLSRVAHHVHKNVRVGLAGFQDITMGEPPPDGSPCRCFLTQECEDFY